MTRSQRKIGVILTYVSEAIKILSALLYTPIMLRLLGSGEYGLYQLVYSVVSYLSLLSLGFGAAYMRFFSRYNEADDQENVARLNGMFMTIFGVISILCILCGVVMTQNASFIFGTGLTNAELDKAKVLMSLMVFNLAVTFLNTVFNCIVTARERFFFQKLLLVAQNLLNPFLTLPLLLLGYGSVGMVLVTTSITVVKFLIDIWFCFRKLHVHFVFKGFKFGLLKEMWIFTFFLFLNQIIDQVNWSVDKFLLGRYAGTVSVAVYGVGAQINSMYVQFSTAVSNVFVPKVNQIVASSDDDNELTKIFIKVGRVQFIIMTLILSGFLIFGSIFVAIWAGAEYSESFYVALLLMTPATVPLIQNLGIEIQRARNKHRARSVVYFCIAIANIFISIPLIKTLGPIGAAWGTAIALVVGNILFMNWYYHFHLGIDIARFWKEIINFIPALIAPVIVGVCIVKLMPLNHFFVFCVAVLFYSVVYGLSMWFLGMNDSEKDMIRKPIRKLLKFRF